MEVIIIVLMLLLSAFFSGSETAFVVANRLRVEMFTRHEGAVGSIVRDFLKNPASLLTTTLVGNNVALIVYSTLMAFYLAPPLNDFYNNVAGMGPGPTEVAVLVTQTLVASLIVLAFGEILPKSMMREFANQAVFVLAVPLRVSYYLLLPMVKVAAWASSLVVRLFGTGAEDFAQFMRRDFEIIIEESKASGELDLDEEGSELLANVLSFNTIRIKESMVPRTDIVAVEENTSLEDLMKRFVRTGLSKLPVYRDNIDQVVGVAFAYDIFQDPKTLAEMMRPAQFVPESKRSKDLLREFLATNTSVAIVIDEYGGTAGLVTREDLLEELFGDIQDEFDTEVEVLRPSGENSFIASGRIHIDELEERAGIALPDGDYETIAGFLLERVGRIPSPKDEFHLEGFHFTVLKSTANRIELVRIVREHETAEADDGAER